MATKLKRDPVKYIRDRAKAAYEKGTECFICRTTESLDFHHFYTLTALFEKWCKANKVTISSEEDILASRDQFIADNHAELYEHAITICHTHHMKLHSVYGKNPPLTTAKKQMSWVQIQRDKHGLDKLDS